MKKQIVALGQTSLGHKVIHALLGRLRLPQDPAWRHWMGVPKLNHLGSLADRNAVGRAP